MQGDVVIRAEGLGKRYTIGHSAARERYVALRDVIARNARALARSAVDLVRGRPNVAGDEIEEFWALRDVSFEIRRGEMLGIIGRNGAGKSTLLKILSRITEPTEGRVEIRGRVASLLEIGTGFHPELTGRENIYLNGAILGMSHAEIRQKFDEIVAFAEVERFLDTPVKRYSSGMYVRLAFAVAAHLEPEILVIDEVLAVGDTEFQKKCLGKLAEVSGGGRTVLFVSHNISAVEALCPRSILLDRGALTEDGRSHSVIAVYLKQRGTSSLGGQFQSVAVDENLQLDRVDLSETGLRFGTPLEINFAFSAIAPGQLRECALLVYTEGGVRVAIVDLRESGVAPLRFPLGRFAISIKIASLPLVEGDVHLGLYLVTDSFSGDLLNLAQLTIAPRPSRVFTAYPTDARGYVVLETSSTVTASTDATVSPKIT